jgi:recombination protein RecT
MSTLPSTITTNFNEGIQKYESTSLTELLSGSGVSPQKFKHVLQQELERSLQLQEAFSINPASFFATALYCAELNLSPSSLVGEFFFNVSHNRVSPILGYKGLVTLLLRNSQVKKIWSEVVYEGDDFEYELGLEPKLMHIPNHAASRKSKDIKYIYACAKLNDEVVFKVMSIREIKSIIEIIELPSELYFNDMLDPEKWMLKKVVLKQLSKLLPKEDDRLKKAVNYDDKIEGGAYLVLDENDSVKVVQGTIVNKKGGIYQSILGSNPEF